MFASDDSLSGFSSARMMAEAVKDAMSPQQNKCLMGVSSGYSLWKPVGTFCN
jgi:hypothetical protein